MLEPAPRLDGFARFCERYRRPITASIGVLLLWVSSQLIPFTIPDFLNSGHSYGMVLEAVAGSASALIGIIIAVTALSLETRKGLVGGFAFEEMLTSTRIPDLCVYYLSTVALSVYELIRLSEPITRKVFNGFYVVVLLLGWALLVTAWAVLSEKAFLPRSSEQLLVKMVQRCNASSVSAIGECGTARKTRQAAQDLIEACTQGIRRGDDVVVASALSHLASQASEWPELQVEGLGAGSSATLDGLLYMVERIGETGMAEDSVLCVSAIMNILRPVYAKAADLSDPLALCALCTKLDRLMYRLVTKAIRDGVRDVAAVGISMFGDTQGALMALTDDKSPGEWRQYLKERLARICDFGQTAIRCWQSDALDRTVRTLADVAAVVLRDGHFAATVSLFSYEAINHIIAAAADNLYADGIMHNPYDWLSRTRCFDRLYFVAMCSYGHAVIDVAARSSDASLMLAYLGAVKHFVDNGDLPRADQWREGTALNIACTFGSISDEMAHSRLNPRSLSSIAFVTDSEPIIASLESQGLGSTQLHDALSCARNRELARQRRNLWGDQTTGGRRDSESEP